MSTYDFVVNQGYSIEDFIGDVNTNKKVGPIEAMENRRADDIDFITKERFKKEKKEKDDEEDSW